MRKALVTGGAGFVGSHLVDALVKLGFKVLVIDNLSTGRRQNVNPAAKFLKMDIRSDELARVVKKFGPDYVFHTAAQINVRLSVEDAELDADINLVGGLKLLEAARLAKVKKIVFSSSGGAIYGNARIIPTPETYAANPLSPYGVSKLSFEHYLHCYEHIYGLPYVSLRYANVYGPRQLSSGEAGVVAVFASQLLRGKQPIINGDGKQTRDYVYVHDIVRANLLALKSIARGVYNIGTGKETSVNMIFKKIKIITGSAVAEKHGRAKAGEERRSAILAKKAARELGWQPRTSLDQGLKKTVAWFKL
ncbi:MAG: GDP-mannose 4,6-dehydratase [bacterium]|nr:GDP-mannose 4,6-dehydratase [bacterium]